MALEKPWDQYPYKVFVSYSHADRVPEDAARSWGAWLEEELSAFEIPKDLVGRWTPFGLVPEKLEPICRDRSDFGAGNEVPDVVRARLDDSATLVVVCSPAAAKSTYVNDEVRYFKSTGRANRVFAFIVAGEPGSGDENECFPDALKYDVDRDGTVNRMRRLDPLAADAREGKDGPRDAVIKLVAGLLNVPLTALKQKTNEILEQRVREQAETIRTQRRLAKRLRQALAGAVAAVVVAGLVGYLAFGQRNEALIAESNYLANQAIEAIGEKNDWRFGEPVRGMRIALEGAPSFNGALLDRPVVSSVDAVLQGAGVRASMLRATLSGHGDSVSSAALSPDGTKIVTGSFDKTARIWNAADGKPVATLTGHEN
jgi:hypothetical protein